MGIEAGGRNPVIKGDCPRCIPKNACKGDCPRCTNITNIKGAFAAYKLEI